MEDVEQHRKLCDSSKLLSDKVKMIKSALKRPAGVGIGLLSDVSNQYLNDRSDPRSLAGQFKHLSLYRQQRARIHHFSHAFGFKPHFKSWFSRAT